MNTLPILLSDSYKQFHWMMYPKGITKLYSNMTPRNFKHLKTDRALFFGLQYYIKEYLITQWNENFFKKPKEEVVKEFKRFHKHFSNYDMPTEHIEKLHDLGYLPIIIKALPEGSFVKEKVPFFTITNTHPDFAWLVNFLETQMSTSIWDFCVVATIAYEYRKILNKWADKTCEDRNFVQWQGHDFAQRGRSSQESTLNQAGHLLSFTGTDTIPSVLMLEKYYNANMEKELIAGSVPACYDKETEVLTDIGFIKFSDLKDTQKVAMYNTDGEVDFVIPSKHYAMKYKGKMIRWRKRGYNYVDICVTPNHKMVRLNQEKNKIDLFEAGDYSYRNRNGYSSRNYLIISGNTISKSRTRHENKLTPMERLHIAFQADGSFPSHKDDYTSGQIRFNLKKQRKIDRLTEILNEGNIRYTKSEIKDTGYVDFWITTNINTFDKEFNWLDISGISQKWCDDFVNELQYWDGCIKNNCICYSNTNKSAIDKIQAICAISGYKTQYNKYLDKRDENRQLLYTLTIQDKTEISGHGFYRQEIEYDDFVYCVSVPTKMLIIRRNNIVCICGNTEHSVMTSYGKEDELVAFERILDQFPTGIVSIVSDSFDLWQVCTSFCTQLKDKILRRDGKMVIRPDSGDPADIVCGANILKFDNFKKAEECFRFHIDDGKNLFMVDDKCYKVKIHSGNEFIYEPYNLNPSEKGVVELLWDVFGGKINSKGYKELDSHIGVIYGDSISRERAEDICSRLEKKGFASNNIVFGIGSYTYNYNTRDSLGIAVKSTYCEVDGIPREIFKDPVTDNGVKKSARGLLKIDLNENRDYLLKDCVSKEEETQGYLKPVFSDGEILVDDELNVIRTRVKEAEIWLQPAVEEHEM